MIMDAVNESSSSLSTVFDDGLSIGSHQTALTESNDPTTIVSLVLDPCNNINNNERVLVPLSVKTTQDVVDFLREKMAINDAANKAHRQEQASMIKQLQNELVDARQEQATMIEQLQSELVDTRKKLQSELVDARKKQANLQNELVDARNEIRDAQEALIQSDVEIKVLEDKLEKLEKRSSSPAMPFDDLSDIPKRDSESPGKEDPSLNLSMQDRIDSAVKEVEEVLAEMDNVEKASSMDERFRAACRAMADLGKSVLGKVVKTRIDKATESTGLSLSFLVEIGTEFKDKMEKILEDVSKGNNE